MQQTHPLFTWSHLWACSTPMCTMCSTPMCTMCSTPMCTMCSTPMCTNVQHTMCFLNAPGAKIHPLFKCGLKVYKYTLCSPINKSWLELMYSPSCEYTDHTHVYPSKFWLKPFQSLCKHACTSYIRFTNTLHIHTECLRSEVISFISLKSSAVLDIRSKVHNNLA